MSAITETRIQFDMWTPLIFGAKSRFVFSLALFWGFLSIFWQPNREMHSVQHPIMNSVWQMADGRRHLSENSVQTRVEEASRRLESRRNPGRSYRRQQQRRKHVSESRKKIRKRKWAKIIVGTEVVGFIF